MKKLILLLAIVLGTTSLFANNDNKKKDDPKQQLQTEVATLLQNPKINFNKDIAANIEFTINSQDEIVVLTVDTDEDLKDNITRYVKSRLNYKKIDVTVASKVYNLKVVFKKA